MVQTKGSECQEEFVLRLSYGGNKYGGLKRKKSS